MKYIENLIITFPNWNDWGFTDCTVSLEIQRKRFKMQRSDVENLQSDAGQREVTDLI